VWKIRLIILFGLFIVANWILDVGHNAYFAGGYDAIIVNGFWSFNALTAYHLAWYISVAVCFVIVYYARTLEKKVQELEGKG